MPSAESLLCHTRQLAGDTIQAQNCCPPALMEIVPSDSRARLRGSTTPDASCHSSTCGCEPIPALRLRSRSISSVSLCSASVAVDS